jgi:hypothetical protein
MACEVSASILTSEAKKNVIFFRRHDRRRRYRGKSTGHFLPSDYEFQVPTLENKK